MARKTWIILGVAVVLIAAAGAWYFLSGDGDMQPVSTGQASGVVYEPLPTDHTYGNPKAKVTVIEYASPTCPVCANFMINYYPKFKSDYIDTGKIFYVYRTFLRGPDDAVAEKLARCMPKDKYLTFNDMLFHNQSRWDYEFGIPSPEGVHAALVQLAGEAGMSAADADRCIASAADEAAISKVGEDGVAKYAINGTPTFVVNGEAEALWTDLAARIDRALAK
ncbi:MAG TPA: thioredoxin domain-containing protein [Rhizomicrobium sp.]|nr:thioredoxin domain-containing protein [Rhizomicrobium sp.]